MQLHFTMLVLVNHKFSDFLALFGDVAICKMLVENGASKDEKDRFGLTPFMYAMFTRRTDGKKYMENNYC